MDYESLLALMAASIYPAYFGRFADTTGDTSYARDHAAKSSLAAACAILLEVRTRQPFAVLAPEPTV